MILVCTCAVTQAADQNDEQQRHPCDPGHDGEGSLFPLTCSDSSAEDEDLSFIPPQRVHADTV